MLRSSLEDTVHCRDLPTFLGSASKEFSFHFVAQQGRGTKNLLVSCSSAAYGGDTVGLVTGGSGG